MEAISLEDNGRLYRLNSSIRPPKLLPLPMGWPVRRPIFTGYVVWGIIVPNVLDTTAFPFQYKTALPLLRSYVRATCWNWLVVNILLVVWRVWAEPDVSFKLAF